MIESPLSVCTASNGSYRDEKEVADLKKPRIPYTLALVCSALDLYETVTVGFQTLTFLSLLEITGYSDLPRS